MGILKEAGRAHRNRAVHHFKQCRQVVNDVLRQGGIEECLEDFGVGAVAERNGIEMVALHKFIKDVCTEHHGLGNAHSEIVCAEARIAADHRPHEGQAASLAAERAVANAGKRAIFVETSALIDGNNACVLHLAITDNTVADELTGFVHVGIFAHIDLLENHRRRKHGSREKETREMVVRQMVAQGVIGDFTQMSL